MAAHVSQLFWDSCVFIAFLNDEHTAYDVGSIKQYLEEARDGKHVIYTSTIALAEIRPSFIQGSKKHETFNDFSEDFKGAIVLVDASPNLMSLAGRLKDLPYKKANSKHRHLATGDAIMLASCLHLANVNGVHVDHFHTFDDGKSAPRRRVSPMEEEYHPDSCRLIWKLTSGLVG